MTTTKTKMKEAVASHPGIRATCPHCLATATATPDYIRGGNGNLDWECSRCRSVSSAERIEEATARVAGRTVRVPRRFTEL